VPEIKRAIIHHDSATVEDTETTAKEDGEEEEKGKEVFSRALR